ncbi:GMC family oxidoreductase [Nocardia sp. NPDC050793]|uniref:GMC family oxidoreductase n=1 Tax=Nocardia sp. NPDC050793 TaxID=3155159 RepID=UPI0033F4CA06
MTDDVGNYYDYCVIGGGASGLVAATELARSGRTVLVLEEGQAVVPGTDLRVAERNWQMACAPGDPARPANPWTARGLGGGTMFFAAIAFRYRELDFDAGSYLAGDALPARWPIGYQDLRACYDEIERRLGVARSQAGDPWQPPSAAAPLPPHEFDARGRGIAAAGRELGLRPFPTPLAINSRPYRGRPACGGCSTCTEHACPTGAKSDAVRGILDQSEVRATIRTGARALRLIGGRPNQLTAVEWVDTVSARRHVTRAGGFVLAANAVQTARLLLASHTPWAPEGVGNSSGLVGTGLSLKLSCYLSGDPDRDPDSGRGGPHSTVAFTDYYLHPDMPGLLGGIIYQANPVRGDRAGALRLHVLAGDQPMRRNRVRLRNTSDEFGVPHLLMDYRIHPSDAERLRFLADRASDILRTAGARRIRFQPSGFHRGSRHLHGTCRAGDDPRHSVTTPEGRLHDVDNAHIVDASVFPFAGGVNPVLTIQANALRIARGLTGRAAEPAIAAAPAADLPAPSYL